MVNYPSLPYSLPVFKMTAVSSSSILSMTKPKLRFSIDALMGNEDKESYRDSSPVMDYSIPKSKSESSSQSGSPTSVLVPIPTFPASGPSGSRERSAVFGSGLYPRTLPHFAPGFDRNLAGMLMQADPYGVFPWYLHHRPRLLQQRFGPGPDLPGFLLPPFRKAKRIRTAFSAAQLMKLEGAFDKNHYVTGNERKQLAESLGLTETQVKVWFQNRRTKAKRQVIEDREKSEKNQSLPSNKESHSLSSPSDPNLSPSERQKDILCDEDDSDDMYPAEDEHEMIDPIGFSNMSE